MDSSTDLRGLKNMSSLISKINSPVYDERMAAAAAVGAAVVSGEIRRQATDEVNNHVHTTYSFSPYEPAMAAWKAWEAGLQIVGSIDHDSISAAPEMLQAGALFGIATTVGFEVRCSFLDTPLRDKKINNPDSTGIVYMCVHGVPVNQIAACRKFLEPIGKARNIRNRAEVEALNGIISRYGLGPIDFDRDVVPLSRTAEGGSITERHILSALAGTIMSGAAMADPAGGGTRNGAEIVKFLEERLQVPCRGRIREYLLDDQNPHYRYDLLGILKGSFLPKFFIQPGEDEIVPARTVVEFARSIGAIPAYAYLGDITDSPTGDKKAEKFEDGFLDELFAVLKDIGYAAVTYMPPRNTKAQLLRVQELARRHGMMEISGVDINSSRQVFSCPEMLEPEFVHLLDSAWALTAHEKFSAVNPRFGLFHPENPHGALPLEERIAIYAKAGKKLDPFKAILDQHDIERSGL